MRYRRLVPLALSQHISKLLQWIPSQLRLLPQIRGQEAIAVAGRHEGSFQRVLQSLGTTSGRCVRVFYTRKLEKAFDSGRCDETGTTGSRNELEISVN